MITILANTDNKILLFLKQASWYIFEFKISDCETLVLPLQIVDGCGEIEEDAKFFEINVNLPSGNYPLNIYAGEFSVEEITNEDLIYTTKAKVYNPETNCYNYPYITDENNYILSDDDGTKIEY